MGCFENPEETCEELRKCVTELIHMANREKSPEKREILNQKVEHNQGKWMRAIDLKRSYQ